MTAEQKSILIRLAAYGTVGVLATIALTSGFGLPIAVAGLSLPAWWPGFANTTLSAIGFNRASDELGRLLRREKPITEHLLNEDIHRLVGRAIAAVILSDTRGNPVAEAIAHYARARFHEFPWPAQAEFDAVREQGIVDGCLSDLAHITSRKALSAAQWETILDLINAQACPSTALNARARGALAKRLEERFASAFFDLLTADDDPHSRVALEEVTLALIGTGFSRVIGPVEALDEAFSGILRRPPTNLHPLRFEARACGFAGRFDQCRAAVEWLQPEQAAPQSDRDFRWASLTGPAGSGKSRFALELALHAGKEGWEWGFLMRGVDPTHIPLKKPTLIVVDYALDRMDETEKVLLRYSNACGQPVRVLLLYRSPDDPRLPPFERRAKKVPVRNATWDLGGRDPHEADMLRRIVVETFARLDAEITAEENKRLVAALQRGALLTRPFFDTTGAEITTDRLDRLVAALQGDARLTRPLFAIMAAEAVMAGRDPDDLSPEDLAEWVVEREFGVWEQAAEAADLSGQRVEALADVMLLATMLGSRKGDGVSADEIERLPKRRPDQRLLYCGASMTRGFREAPPAMPPIEPDLVGEMYAIERLTGRLCPADVGPDQARASARAAADLAWQLDAEVVSLFVGRAWEDFPSLMGGSEGLGRIPDFVESRSGLLAGTEAAALVERKDWEGLRDHARRQVAYVSGGHMPDWEHWCDPMASALERVPEIRRPVSLLQTLDPLERHAGTAWRAFALAKALHVLCQHAEAEKLYRKALERDPGYADAMNDLAILLTDLADGRSPGPGEGRTEGDLRAEAEALYRKALERDPDDARAMNNLANLVTDLADGKAPGPGEGRTEGGLRVEAEDLYRKALERDPGVALAMNNLAILLTQLADGRAAGPGEGRSEGDLRVEAENLYRRALERDPGYAVAMSNLAYLVMQLADGKSPGPGEGRTEGGLRAEAEKLLRKAPELDPDDANAWANWAWSLFGVGDLAQIETAVAQGLAVLGRYSGTSSDLELRFYDYVLHPDAGRLARLKDLIARGVRSPGWDLRRVVAHASASGHPDSAWLAKLADVIAATADSATLDPWPAWRDAANP
jgi:tetratricopeptide (TPR) repeat protein